MRIRLAEPADLEKVGELTVTAYEEFTEGPEDGYIDRLRDAAGRAREAELWLAEDAGQIVGTVTICPEDSPWREIGRPGEGEFRMLAVAPEARGQGVGDALVANTLRVLAERGCTGVVLSSLEEMAAAHRLYGRHGFTRAPERDWAPAPGVDLIAFYRSL
ncbi:GNAT family N-acetyltransferase [Nocardioides speluncae]|uniref:GNAT family N-acetyltransferase n=1 Tax=Nocardioides speluncae TaxID=2670337 RepID=UPI000D69D538|nr:GNAT family N-acetyltransferase [Nocardioides speluncae]